MTKAQQTYERVNALVEAGTKKAEAFKQLAEEYGQPVDSVRGAYYGHKRAVEGGGVSGAARSRSRKRETTTQDAVASAVATLRGAIDSIEIELEVARERADEARAEYQAMQAASGGRIKEIRAKIAVLDPEADDDTPPDAGTHAAVPTEPAVKPPASKTTTREEVKGSS
jgi:multidrug resistance efflux pump